MKSSPSPVSISINAGEADERYNDHHLFSTTRLTLVDCSHEWLTSAARSNFLHFVAALQSIDCFLTAIAVQSWSQQVEIAESLKAI
jgi:hypothetical protein